MFGTDSEERVAHLVDPHGVEMLDVLSLTVDLLTPFEESDDGHRLASATTDTRRALLGAER